jgi:hypothetical protein
MTENHPNRTAGHRPILSNRFCRNAASTVFAAVAIFQAEGVGAADTKSKPCEQQGGPGASVALVGAPSVLLVRPSHDAGVAVGRLLVRNEGTSPLLRLCLSAHLTDYQEQPTTDGVELMGQKDAQNNGCIVTATPAVGGAIQELVFTIKVDPKRLPLAGTVIVGAAALTEVKKESNASSSSSGQVPPEKCEMNTKEISQAVVVTLGSSVLTERRIIIVSTAASILFLILTLSILWKHLKNPMGASQWSFSSSTATNITFLGTILGTALASSALPDYLHYMTKQGYIVTSLLFSVVAGIAPVLYNFCCKPFGASSTDPQQPDLRGNVFLFLLADSLTIWAATGQLVTLSFMFAEFVQRFLVPAIAEYLAGGIAIVSSCALMVFCLRIAKFYAKDHPARAGIAKEADMAGVGVLVAPRWNAL